MQTALEKVEDNG